MLYLTEMIMRLRKKCPSFNKRVGGLASFKNATVTTNDIACPHAFVVPSQERADDAVGNLLSQEITEGFSIVVALDTSGNREDGHGVDAHIALEQIRRELFGALIGWEPVQFELVGSPAPPGFEDVWPTSRADYFRYSSGEALDLLGDRFWYQFDFVSRYQMACYKGQFETRKELVTFVDGKANFYEPALWKNEPDVEAVVRTEDGWRYVKNRNWTIDHSTGEMVLLPTSQMENGKEYAIIFKAEYSTPILRKIYAAYYPEVLEAAGGNPHLITADMFDLVSELPIDATIKKYFNPYAGYSDPQWTYALTYTLEDNIPEWGIPVSDLPDADGGA